MRRLLDWWWSRPDLSCLCDSIHKNIQSLKHRTSQISASERFYRTRLYCVCAGYQPVNFMCGTLIVLLQTVIFDWNVILCAIKFRGLWANFVACFSRYIHRTLFCLQFEDIHTGMYGNLRRPLASKYCMSVLYGTWVVFFLSFPFPLLSMAWFAHNMCILELWLLASPWVHICLTWSNPDLRIILNSQ